MDREMEYRALLEKFDATMNRLSMRVGITVKEVANILNPLGDEVREALKRK